jgi:hypothetical protein
VASIGKHSGEAEIKKEATAFPSIDAIAGLTRFKRGKNCVNSAHPAFATKTLDRLGLLTFVLPFS